MPWSVAHTHPNAAGVACRNLERQGFPFYDPKVKERIKLKRGLVWRTVQLFSNYIFVDTLDHWRAVCSTRGISQLLMADGKPAVIADSLIDAWKAQENSEGLITFNESKFKFGDAVQVKSGPLAFQAGTFDGMSSRDRVFVLLASLGRLEVAEDNLIAV